MYASRCSEISEKALLRFLDAVEDVFAEMADSIREEVPRLSHVDVEDYDNSHSSPSKRARKSKDERSGSDSGSGGGSGSGAAATGMARPAFTMEITDTLNVLTDTDPKHATFAHKQLLALLESSSDNTEFAQRCGVSFVGRVLAALSTPTAALYANLTPAPKDVLCKGVGRLHSTLVNDTTAALRQEVRITFAQRGIGTNPRLMADHVTGRDRHIMSRPESKTDVGCFDAFDRLVNLAMEKYAAHLTLMRAYWASRPVPMVSAVIVKTTMPPPPEPAGPYTRQPTLGPQKVEIIRTRLPLSVVPISSLHETSAAHSSMFVPSTHELKLARVMAMMTDSEGTMDAAKYCLVNWLMLNDKVTIDDSFPQATVLESRTANLLVVKYLAECDEDDSA